MHPLCLDFLTAVEASPPALATLAAENGLELIAIMAHPVEGVPDFGMASDTPMRRDTKRRCGELGPRRGLAIRRAVKGRLRMGRTGNPLSHPARFDMPIEDFNS